MFCGGGTTACPDSSPSGVSTPHPLGAYAASTLAALDLVPSGIDVPHIPITFFTPLVICATFLVVVSKLVSKIIYIRRLKARVTRHRSL